MSASNARRITPNSAAAGGIPSQKALEVSQRNYPRRARRHGLPHPDPHFQGQARCLLLEKADHHRAPRLRRHLQGGRVPRPRSRAKRSWSSPTRKRRESSPARPSTTSRDPACLQAMHNRDDSILSFARCCFTYALIGASGRLVLKQGHDLQGLRSDLQAPVPEGLRRGVQGTQFDEPPAFNYRYALIDDVACEGHPLRGRHDLGVQKLRWRRDERPDCRRLREPSHDDERPRLAGWELRVRGCARDCRRPLPQMARRKARLHQSPAQRSPHGLARSASAASSTETKRSCTMPTASRGPASTYLRTGYLSEDLARLCDPAELREMPENGRADAADPRAARGTL